MKRKNLNEIVEKFIDEYSNKSYSELINMSYPITIEYKLNEQVIDVEIDKLEVIDDFIHISAAASSGDISALFPVSSSFIVHKDGRVEKSSGDVG